jgi:hypothetical protein
MQTTPAGDLVEHLASYNGRRLFRQHVSRLRHVLVAVPVGLPGQDARVGGTRMAVSPETVRDLDQAPRPRRRLGDASGRDVQAGCQPPGRWGIAAVKRHGAPPPIIVNEGRRRHVHVTADQHALGAGGGAQGGAWRGGRHAAAAGTPGGAMASARDRAGGVPPRSSLCGLAPGGGRHRSSGHPGGGAPARPRGRWRGRPARQRPGAWQAGARGPVEP